VGSKTVEKATNLSKIQRLRFSIPQLHSLGIGESDQLKSAANFWPAGFEFALERKFKNMQRTGCVFYTCKPMVGCLIVVVSLRGHIKGGQCCVLEIEKSNTSHVELLQKQISRYDESALSKFLLEISLLESA
jgi:hypothetical protein